ncbi:efflux RND transporter permease subunit [Neolewinella agarilytica]|uniref:Multidrug efflux pump subunit AcrB n=1 Tax=Neolewinella agarilytica TaxID=478744 RepID=A0A1H9MMA4_9BACT|nr:efflux RND transporter permease subunit [Neolewinella agarilytica]SER24830.1 Multidrug efflux pump subunit AcrB [Neolewinella agarilytica]
MSNNKGFNIVELAMKHKQIAIIITAVLFAFGIFSLMVMPRNEFPEFTIRQGLVVGVYPGATSEEVEEQLTKTVEEFLYGFKEVNREKTYSISKEGTMIVFVEVNNNVKDPDAFWDKIKFGLNQLKAQLPPQVLALIANNDFGDTSALLLTIESKEKNKKQLEKQLEFIEAELRKVTTVSKVKHFGLQNEQITINFDKDKLAHYGVNLTSVLAALQLEGSIYYAGEIDNSELITPIHVPTSFRSEREIKSQIIYADPLGNIIRVRDVAEVSRGFEEPSSYILNNGSSAILVSLEMQGGNNIVQFGEDVELALEKIRNNIPSDVVINKIANMPEAVDHSIQHFLKEFFIAIGAVILVTLLFLPFRVSAVAGITIPLSIFITIGILYILGIELHTVSLAGLIVVLGMVVDNAIVIIDNYVEKLDEGMDRWNAAIQSTTELFVPVFAATLCIIATYLPMPFFLSGQTGDFVSSLPVTISIALIVSLLIATLLVPFMCYYFIKEGVHKGEEEASKFSLLNLLQAGYNKTLDWAFKVSALTIFLGIGSIVLGAFIMSIVPRQLYPKVERNQFAIEIYLQEGATLNQTAFVADSLRAMLSKDERVENVASFIGESSPRFHTTYAPKFPGKNYGQLLVNTQTDDQAIEILAEYEVKYRDAFPNAYVRMKQLDMQSTEAPVELRISGDDLPTLKAMAERVKETMEDHPGVIWVRTDYTNPRQGVRINVDDEQANRLGLTRGAIAASLGAGFSGFPVGTVWEGNYPIPVKVINPEQERDDYDDISNQTVTSPFAATPVALRQVATINNDWSEGQIVRRNGIRTITVRADLERGALAYKILADLKPQINELEEESGAGLTFSYGGEEEAEVENYIPIGKALGVGIVIIFFVLLFEFKTIKHTLLIMTTMPLSILGAALGILLTGYAFGMTASLGVMSLMGIVVRNGIILVDYAEELRHEKNMNVIDAAMAAGKRRMRPIFLTSFAAAMGVVPMIASGSTLWGPLGAVVCFGLIVSMVLTIYVLPVLYSQFFKNATI